MVALFEPTAEPVIDEPISVPQDSPYRIVLDRIRRLVEYRGKLARAIAQDPLDPRSHAEITRVKTMIREVHRAVSMNADARQLAAKIDASELGA